MDRRKKQNLISAIVAALGIILILGVIWVVSKDYRFNAYQNENKGFSIDYPASWSFEENTGGAAVIFLSPQENDLDFFKESVNVVVQDISGNPMELKEYSELAIEQMEAVFGENFVILESGLIFVAGQKGYKLVFIGKGPDTELQYMSVWTISGLSAYQITYTALSSKYDRYLPKMKRMVRSFKLE